MTHSGITSIYAAEDYLSRNVASLWFPTDDNQISVVSNKLHGWRPQQVFGNWLQSRWYFTKTGQPGGRAAGPFYASAKDRTVFTSPGWRA